MVELDIWVVLWGRSNYRFVSGLLTLFTTRVTFLRCVLNRSNHRTFVPVSGICVQSNLLRSFSRFFSFLRVLTMIAIRVAQLTCSSTVCFFFFSRFTRADGIYFVKLATSHFCTLYHGRRNVTTNGTSNLKASVRSWGSRVSPVGYTI